VFRFVRYIEPIVLSYEQCNQLFVLRQVRMRARIIIMAYYDPSHISMDC